MRDNLAGKIEIWRQYAAIDLDSSNSVLLLKVVLNIAYSNKYPIAAKIAQIC